MNPADASSPGDGGVPERIRRRTTVGAGGVIVVGVLVALAAYAWPGWAWLGLFASVLSLVVLCGFGVVATVLAARARAWVATDAALAEPGVEAVVGPPRPLHTVRPGRPVNRKRLAQVVPVRAPLADLAGGRALIVHGRDDGLVLAGGDPVEMWNLGGRSGPFLIRRRTDGAVFAAGAGTLAAW